MTDMTENLFRCPKCGSTSRIDTHQKYDTHTQIIVDGRPLDEGSGEKGKRLIIAVCRVCGQVLYTDDEVKDSRKTSREASDLPSTLEELGSLIESFENLDFGDTASRDLLMKKAESVIRTAFGADSVQAQQLAKTSFNVRMPSPAPSSEEIRRKVWEEKKRQMINSLTVFKEEAEMARQAAGVGANISGGGTQAKGIQKMELTDMHPEIRKKCGKLYSDQHFSEAVGKSFMIVKDRLRQLTGHESGSDAFGKGNLHIKGASASNVDEDFNEGVKFLTMAIDRFRNEKFHTSDANISDPVRAYQYLAMSSLAMSFLDNAEILKP